MAADMLTNHLVRDLDDHDLSVLHTRNTQNGLVGVACVNPLHKKISRPARLVEFRLTPRWGHRHFRWRLDGVRP